ncbi:ileal sodium/bile acid cotransporter-like protein [Dinothrombium tinctorium]|uniref:Ileal sodium/bile acid cotransporter-like protein n=1 Tax=Dinothrombium tinctorium TaxID=1965070 RepID=A0A443R1X9_9ACAR|nr:ileal sodium/bile acid cotransporter-like protein [Dinothrombium tinctorium]RWS10419.1 ileal sodium/bile acid cotransporter-like protein [Dinothrombium tinctorium]RWS12332.1 ileal sodium/bile acid cotransporter-like protein [Dinothrombium tinctorium]
MCPVVLLALISSLILFLMELTAALTVTFSSANLTMKEEQTKSVQLSFSEFEAGKQSYEYYVYVQNPAIASIVDNDSISVNTSQNVYNASVRVKGKFLGFTYLNVVRKKDAKNDGNISVASSGKNTSIGEKETERHSLPVIVTLKGSKLSQIFTISVAVLVSLNYINMGCALDLSVVKSVIKRPIGPIVGFLTQYLAMPLTAYIVGYLLLNEPFLKLGLFTFGCSPGGGASNMWTVLFGGNLNLSITMTFISTLCAVFVMPFWLFTLGRTIFEGTTTKVPFQNIMSTLFSMIVCLGIGLLFQKYLPRVAQTCRRILAPVSIGMIIFIIIFGTYANLFMFKYMSWQILLSAALNVWIGFLIGILSSLALRLSIEDMIAIAIETGIQNTGVAIVLLRLSLPEPDRDLATVVPVAGSIMTPIPLAIILIYRKVRNCMRKRSKEHTSIDESKKESPEEGLSNNTSTSTLVYGVKSPISASTTDLFYDLESSQNMYNFKG